MNEMTAQIANDVSESIIYAGFWRRFFATVVDQIILFVLGGAMGFILGLIGLKDQIIIFSLSSLLSFIYFVVYNCSSLSGTPGKAILGIAIVDEKTKTPISFKQAILRVLTAFLSGLVLCLGYLIQPFTAKRQTFHDMIAETVVIQKKHGEVNYFTVFKESFSKILNQ